MARKMTKKPATKPASKPGTNKLGRGLSALMADIAVPEAEPAAKPKTPTKKPTKKPAKKPLTQVSQPGGTLELPIDLLERNPAQPRKIFDKAKLAELTNSIAQKGVLQPILVRPLPDSKTSNKTRYQIVAGERRWHAAQAARLETIPALVRDLTDREVLEIGVIENVQRADLNPLEEARAYRELVDQFGRKQIEIAGAIGKSRAHVANSMRLLNLPRLAQDYLQDGKITAGHARAILAAPDPQALTEAIVRDGLSVRAAEQWVRIETKSAKSGKKPAPDYDPNLLSIERELSGHIGMDVRINHKIPGGSLSVKYKTMEQLDDLIKRLQKS